MIDQQKTRVFEFSGYRISDDERILKRNGEVISLPPKVIDLLLVLLQSGGRVLTKDELMQTVWADTFVEETNLTHNISLLRRVLGEKQNGTKFIETIPRRGYRFAADVRLGDDEDLDIVEVQRTDMRLVVDEEIEATVKDSKRTFGLTSRRLLGAGLVGAIILGVFGSWYFARNSADPPGTFQFSEARRISTDGTAKMATVSADGKFVAYVTSKDRRHTLWVKNISTGSGVPILVDAEAPIKSVRFGPSDRLHFVMNDALHHIPILGGPVQKVLTLAGGSANQIFTFSPDGKKIAFMRVADDNNTSPIFVANTDGSDERLLVSTRRPSVILRSPTWSPDGTMIAAITLTEKGFQTVSVISVADGTVSEISTTPKFGSLEQVEWMPSGGGLLVLSWEGEVWQIDYPSGVGTRLSDSLSKYKSISVTADGKSLVGTKQEADGHIWLLEVAERSRERQLTQGFDKNDGATSLDWLANDKIRFEAGASGESWTINADGSGAVLTTARPGYMSTVSPDRKFIVNQAQNDDGSYGLVRVRIADGEHKPIVTATAAFPRISPDGKWVVYTDYRDDVSIWRVSVDGGEPIRVTKLPGDAVQPVVSPDGKKLAFVWWESPANDAPAKVVVASFPEGSVISTIAIPMQWEGEAGGLSRETIEWTADGEAIDFIRMLDGVSNIWRQPLNGAEPTQVTFFETGRIANFASSPDRKHIALSRGNFASDVFLIESRK